jgi:Protein of unknown function (DUF2726)
LAASPTRRNAASGRFFASALGMVAMTGLFRTSRRRKIRRRPSQCRIFQPRHFLLSKNEIAFFRVLAAVVGRRYVISCKVRLADIITCGERDWKRGHANRIAQKHVDFVISTIESSRIVAAIELDDRSHDRLERRARDAFVNRLFLQMRIRLIRVPAQRTYDSTTVASQLAKGGLFVEMKSDEGGEGSSMRPEMKCPTAQPSVSPSHRKPSR